MRAHRTLAVLATAGVMLAATASAALVGPSVATAAPAPNPPVAGGPQAYPPPPPTMTVNRALVKVNQQVRVSGNHFQYREHVSIAVIYRTAKKTVKLTVVADRYGRFSFNEKLIYPGYVVISAYGPKSHFYSWAYVIVQKKKGPHGVTTQVVPAGPAAARPAPTKAAINTFNPLVAQQRTGPLGLGGGVTNGSSTDNGAAHGNSADLVANSKDLTPAGGQFPLGAVGGALAAVGILLTVLAFRRRRPEADG